ncbi:MAG: FprA family A-type flavoprotein [Candidatus Omnitrophica bacterium]|nr:FprA family A-type flavoprotein [Candidatus Omnitrophota bacterium]
MELIRNIFCIKAIDWDIANFHGYSTPFGTTYNGYLIRGEKNILIDTAKYYCENEFFEKIENILPVDRIDFVISNHAEMDHSGLIEKVIAKSNATLICSPKGKENLEKHFHKKFEKIIAVENGQILSLGNTTFQFFHTPMVHWPDSMCAYFIDKKILFSSDAFGQHFAGAEFFADEVGSDIIFREARKYYANIVNPYGAAVRKTLAAISGLQIEMILPAHGLIWRKPDDIKNIVNKYSAWASNQSGEKVLIIYETMWGSTKKMAEKCYIEAVKRNYKAEMFNLDIRDISDIVAEMPEAKIVLFGSSILHGQILPKMAGLLTYLTGLRFEKRKAWTFGSYGWARSSFERFEALVKAAGFEMPCNGYYVQFVPDENSIQTLIKQLKSGIFDPSQQQEHL